VVEEAKDLNPLRVRLFRYNGAPSAVDHVTRTGRSDHVLLRRGKPALQP
jgi:hypothetical protein